MGGDHRLPLQFRVSLEELPKRRHPWNTVLCARDYAGSPYPLISKHYNATLGYKYMVLMQASCVRIENSKI